MTTYKQKFEQLMKTAVETASARFLEDGEHPLTSWVIEDKYDTRILIAFAPDVSKENMLTEMRKIARDKEIVRYTVATEAWMAIQKDNDSRRPAERPDRMEALVIYGQDRQNNNSCVTIEIERKGDKAFLGEHIEGAGGPGNFQLFPEEG